ncbi:MAG: hypothetical protein KKE05_05220, partial [Nanoarchaeota archaeon]|nr:hypothetical protein [Nanoarchaeota archaeon]
MAKKKANGGSSEIERMKKLMRSVRYRGIDQTSGYDRDPFVEAYSEFSDLEKYAAAVNKDPHNLGARRDLFGLIFGNKDAHNGVSPEMIKQTAKDFVDGSKENIGRYAARNFDGMFDDLDPKALESMLFSVQLYKTGKDREHDDLVDTLAEFRQLREMLEKKDIGAIRKYALESLKDEDLPDPIKGAVAHLAKVDDGMAHMIFDAKYNALNAIIAQALYNQDGSIDEAKARKLIKDS